jgi:ankyrin repeat protein
MTGLDSEGRSALHYAALKNDPAEAAELLAGGSDPNLSDQAGFTPLHFAAQEGSVDVARILVNNGARVDPTNGFGNTPLWVAVFNSQGHGDMIALLRQHGADPLKENRNGQTPAGLARLIGNYDVGQFFEDLSS